MAPERFAKYAHPVKINTFHRIIHVRYGASVHESLLHNISEYMDEQLERYEEFEGASEGQPSLLSDGCDLSSKRAVEMWTDFLYGQSMWTLRSAHTIKQDFWALFAVYTFARTYVHWFAEDAALDAIRVMLTEHDSALGDLTSLLAGLYEHEKFKTLVDMLMDFTVHGPSPEEARLWAESDDVGEDKDVLEL